PRRPVRAGRTPVAGPSPSEAAIRWPDRSRRHRVAVGSPAEGRHTLSGPGAGTEEKGGFRMHAPETALLPCGTPVPGGRLPTDVGRCSSAQNEGPVRPGGGLTGP